MSSAPEHRPHDAAESGAGLAARLRSGEPAAMAQVQERVRRIVRFRRLGIPSHELADLEQDVMTQVWRAVNRPGFDPEAGIWGFVEVVASRRCIDWIRARRNQLPLDEAAPDSGRDPLARALGLESGRLASAALASLDGPCRELILLRVGDEMSFKDLSARLGRSEPALRVQMYRCVRSARKALERLGWPPKSTEDRR
jgi:RNA polymerase sigma factor (sigma-70 family)